VIIWKGWGILVVVITFLVLMGTELAVGAIFGNPHYYQAHSWPKGVAFLLAALAVYFLGCYLSNRPGRVVIDKVTGQELVLRRSHALFFIPMEYWGYILAVIGLVLFFVS
jgi:hypothetical protein